MSGAISIPFAFGAFFSNGHQKRNFAGLAFVALWVFAIGVARKNYQILEVQKPKKDRAMLTEMIDLIRYDSSQSPVINVCGGNSKQFDPIGALIKFSNDIQTEDHLKWFCDEFENNGYKHPFENFEPFTEDLLQGQWLTALREARLAQQEIKTEQEALQFLATEWRGKKIWPDKTLNAAERTQQNMFKKAALHQGMADTK